MNSTITWLHISDTHFCKEKHDFDSMRVIDCFFEDLDFMKTNYNLYPDLIFFTGDLVYSCTESTLESQYKEAQEFLDKILRTFSIKSNNNVFIVPGNHDVNRASITPDQTFWLDEQVKKNRIEASSNVNTMIQKNTPQFQKYMERLNKYKKFLEVNDYKHLLEDPDRLTYSTVRDINGFNVGIVGLNSVWSSRGGSDEDRGRLWLGTYQISKAYNKIKNTTFSIVISHHPPDWFTFMEEKLMCKYIRNEFQFYLFGHEHEEWVTPIENYIRITSGALYNGFEQKHGYNFVRLYPHENRGEIFLRTYNGARWIPDIIGNETDNEGRWNLQGIFNESFPILRKNDENNSSKESKNSESNKVTNIKESEKISNKAERKDIENRLELFYAPAQNAIMVANKFIKEPQNQKTWSEICKHKRGYEHQDMTPFERASIYVVEELKLIANYRFLAKKDTIKSFEKYVYEEESEENYLELSRLINKDIEDYQESLNNI